MYALEMQPSVSSSSSSSAYPPIDQLVNVGHPCVLESPPLYADYSLPPLVYCRELPPSPDPALFSPPSIASSSASSESSEQPNVLNISDEELSRLSVRTLNKLTQGLDRRVVASLKQRRRTLKNRSYALTCRVRRVQNQLQLEAENVMLHKKCQQMGAMLAELRSRLAAYEPPVFASFGLQAAHQPPLNAPAQPAENSEQKAEGRQLVYTTF
ncbi:Transcription factor Maf [Aphelenchoides fujianensis]|nr:Transcription factor Maf [Aphelenchoides fujianensis]